MSDTPRTDAWKLEVCGQGNSAYLAWPQSVWDGIEELEAQLAATERELKVTGGMLDSMSEHATQTGIKLAAAEKAVYAIDAATDKEKQG